MPKKTNTLISTNKLLLLGAVLLVAFLPAVARMAGFELIQTNNSRISEVVTLLLSVIGGMASGWLISPWAAKKHPSIAPWIAFVIGLSVAVLAWFTNVFSMFAFR